MSPLPAKVLHPHEHLGDWIGLTLEERWLAVLLPSQHRPQRLPGGRLTLIDRRVVRGPDRQEHIDRDAHGGDAQEREREAPVARHAGVEQHSGVDNARRDEDALRFHPRGHEHRENGAEGQELGPFGAAALIGGGAAAHQRREQENRDHRSHQHAHHVVRRGQGQQVDNEQQVVIVRLTGLLIVPAHDQPQDQGDRHQAQRVHLLVHDRLVPYGERGGADERAPQRGEAAGQGDRHDRPHPALADQEPARRGHGARGRRKQVDALRIAGGERQHAPHMRHHREQRIAGRMGDPQDLRGGDVFRRVPELGGRGQRGDVQRQRAQEDEAGPEIRRSLLDGIVHVVPDARWSDVSVRAAASGRIGTSCWPVWRLPAPAPRASARGSSPA